LGRSAGGVDMVGGVRRQETGKVDGMDEDERERLRAVIASSDETVDEDGGSPDPVGQRRVVAALVSKARALGKLGRYEERIGVWDEMARLFADDPPPGRPLIALQAAAGKALDQLQLDRPAAALEISNRLLDGCAERDPSDAVALLTARALAVKRDALARMGREREAVDVGDEIVRRFYDAELPRLRGLVNRALGVKSRAAWRANRVEDALEISRLLVARFETEPDESLTEVAKSLTDDLTRLMRIGSPDLGGIAWTIFVAAINCGSVALRTTAARLAPPGSMLVVSTPSIDRANALARSLVGSRTAQRLASSRQRLAQALAVSQAITGRLEGSDDPELQELAAVAQIARGMVLFVLGHPRSASRTLKYMTSGDHPGTIEAWQQLARMFAAGPHALGKIGAASALSFRADALAGGDPHIAHIAYDDSLHDHAITDQSTLVKLVARGLRPRTARKRRR
jgi:tetratricopeptide (TPR) repeat protein